MLNFIAKAAIQIGLSAASMALTMSRKIEGPRLDDLKFTSGDYGNPLPMVWGMRRVQAPIFWAEDLKEVKQQNKTKGGKYNDYKYLGTWAVALAGHEIQSVRRIWFDTHLVFDLSGTGPVTPFDFGVDAFTQLFAHTLTETGKASGHESPYFAIYTGTETQDPDPRIKATTEAKHGEGSCPAYRGTAYIVFKEVPLEKVGNRIPQVAVEFIANSATDSIPTEVKPTLYDPVALAAFDFAPDYSFFGFVGNAGWEVWDTASRTRMISGTEVSGILTPIGMSGSGDIFFCSGNQLLAVGVSGYRHIADFEATYRGAQQGVTLVSDHLGQEHWGTFPYSTVCLWYFDGSAYDTDWQACCYFGDTFGGVWVVGKPPGATNRAEFRRLITGTDAVGPDAFTLTLDTTTPFSINGEGASATYVGNDQIALWWASGVIYIIDAATGTVTSSHPMTGDLANIYTVKTDWTNLPPGSLSVWQGQSEYSLVTGELQRTITGIPLGGSAYTVYDPRNHAVIQRLNTPALKWWYLDRAVNDGVTLGTIAAALSDMVNAQGTDFSDLDQIVYGWSATQGQASSILEPLLDAYDADIRPHNFTLQGLKRRGASGGTLLTERFVAANPRYSVKVRQAAELPRAVTVNFADLDADQQPNNARADRPLDATGARGEKSIDLSTLALHKDGARDLADRYFRRIWNERTEVSFALTAQQLALEPGDVRTIDLDGEQITARLTKLTVKADDSLAADWVYDNASLATLAGGIGASFDGRDPSVVIVPMISKGFVEDIPLLTDAHNSTNPLLYLAAAPYASGTWPGATVFEQTTGGEYSIELSSIASTSAATWGHASAALGDANPNLWDRLNSVNVKIQTGTLTGCTEAEIDALPTRNLALIGDELVNFTTATLQTDGSYTLSGFKRGRRGTEWATGTHAVNDVFLLLSNVSTSAMGLSDVGTNLSFKAVTSGRTASSAFPIAVAPFTGASLKPYAPCHLTALQDTGTGDWTLAWTRRTRVGGAWTSSTPISLGETSEAYEVDILDGLGAVKRTITGLSSPSAAYTAAQQVTDFGATQSTLHWRVYQISSAVGRGFAAAA